MEFTIDTAQVTALIACATAVSGVLVGAFRLWTRFKRLEKHDKADHAMLIALVEAQFATLDGLRQLGANGKVTEAYDKLQKTVIQR